MNSIARLAVAAVLAGFLFASTSPAHAGDDHDGPGLGDDCDRGGSYVLRDERGRRTGTLEEAPGGTLIQRDTNGRRVGTIEQGWGGETVVRGTRGHRVGTIEPRR